MKRISVRFGILSLLLAAGTSFGDTPRPVESVFADVTRHDFHPLDDTAFTIDRNLQRHGIASLEDTDWKVRLLAVGDLVRSGEEGIPAMVDGLRHQDVQVRYVAATSLGVLRAAEAIPRLEYLLREDSDPIARSQAAVALGQMESTGSLELLRERLATDPSKDVRHQCELAIDQIEKGMGATAELRAAYASLDSTTFKTVQVGKQAPDFALPDTEGNVWRLSEQPAGSWKVLIWVFADWCPVCHREFRELIELREEIEAAGIRVATIEAHDTYRTRVMAGKEVDPEYWFAEESFQEVYVDNVWWPHLADRAGAVGAMYGVDPMAFSVHAEYINRPATIIIDPEGVVRFAYYGTFWGDRPSVRETLDLIRSGRFEYEHPRRLKQTENEEGGN